MTYLAALDIHVGRTGVERYRWLCSDSNPHAAGPYGRETYRAWIIEQAAGPWPPERITAGIDVSDPDPHGCCGGNPYESMITDASNPSSLESPPMPTMQDLTNAPTLDAGKITADQTAITAAEAALTADEAAQTADAATLAAALAITGPVAVVNGQVVTVYSPQSAAPGYASASYPVASSVAAPTAAPATPAGS